MCQARRRGQTRHGMNQSVGSLENISEAPAAGPLLPPSRCLPGSAPGHIWQPIAADANSLYHIRRGAGLSFPANHGGHVDASSTPGLLELAGSFLPDFWHRETGNKLGSGGWGIRHHVPQISNTHLGVARVPGVSSGHSACSLLTGNSAAAEEN